MTPDVTGVMWVLNHQAVGLLAEHFDKTLHWSPQMVTLPLMARTRRSRVLCTPTRALAALVQSRRATTISPPPALIPSSQESPCPSLGPDLWLPSLYWRSTQTRIRAQHTPGRRKSPRGVEKCLLWRNWNWPRVSCIHPNVSTSTIRNELWL